MSDSSSSSGGGDYHRACDKVKCSENKLCKDGKPQRHLNNECCACPEDFTPTHNQPHTHTAFPCSYFGKGMCNTIPMCNWNNRTCTQNEAHLTSAFDEPAFRSGCSK